MEKTASYRVRMHDRMVRGSIGMAGNEGRKTTPDYWNAAWQGDIRGRLPSRLNVDVFNITRLIGRHVKPGDHYLEVGCAPGKLLAWAAAILGAKVTGLDYSESGIAKCRALFDTLGLEANFHQADLFKHDLPSSFFDVVASFGFIEHFDNASLVVHRHFDLVKPGGVVLLTIPNYGGIYGMLQNWCDASNLCIHNLGIMNTAGLSATVDWAGVETVRAYAYGAMSPWLLSLDKRLPKGMAKLIALVGNALGLIQPLPVKALAPMLVLEVRKRQDT